MSLDLNGKLSATMTLNGLHKSDEPINLNGHLSVTEELVSVYNDREPSELTGHLSIPKYIGETYKGLYEVTPTGDFQLLPTADCVLIDDILVHPIPYSEVSNEQGGITVTIGE